MRFRKLAAGLGVATAIAATATGAHALTYVEDLYTLTGAEMSGSFTSVTAGGTDAIRYYSNGQDYIYQNITVTEYFPDGPTYTYNLSQNCNSLAPNCGLNVDNVYSQYPGGGSFPVQLSIDFYALNGSNSVVPVSFTDFVFDASGSGDLSYVRFSGSSAPEPAAWALLLAGLFGLGGALRRARRTATLPTT